MEGNALAGSHTIDLTGLSGTITVNSLLPSLSRDFSIMGPGAATLEVQGTGTALNPFRIFKVDAAKSCTISGLDLTGGYAKGLLGDSGGAIANYGTLLLISVDIRGNYAEDGGGGLYNEGEATLSSVLLHGNTAASRGGGILNMGDLYVSGGAISSNNAQNGAGIYNAGGDCQVNSGCVIVQNIASIDGGGVFNTGTFAMNGGVIGWNQAGTNGGGIRTQSPGNSTTLTNVDLNGNQGWDGGGFYASGATITIIGGFIRNNTVNGMTNTAGGAFHVATGGNYTLSGVSVTDPINPV